MKRLWERRHASQHLYWVSRCICFRLCHRYAREWSNAAKHIEAKDHTLGMLQDMLIAKNTSESMQCTNRIPIIKHKYMLRRFRCVEIHDHEPNVHKHSQPEQNGILDSVGHWCKKHKKEGKETCRPKK